MAHTRHRAEVTSRSRADQSWDAGLHAESDRGPIQVGLSVESSAMGVVVEAPGVGVLRLAFDVTAEGAVRLNTATRTLDDGRSTAVIAVDEAKVLQLEGALRRADDQRGVLETERDEARHRAAALMEERRALEDQLATVDADAKAQIAALAADLQIEKDQRLVALGEREKSRADLERMRDELDAGSATLVREVNEARAAQEASEAQRAILSKELTELSHRLESRIAELKNVEGAKRDLEVLLIGVQEELATALTRVRDADEQRDATKKALDEALVGQREARATAAQKEQELAEITEKFTAATQAEASSKAELESLCDELETVRRQFSEMTDSMSAAQAAHHETNERLSTRVSELERQLSIAQADHQRQLVEVGDARDLANERISTLESEALRTGQQLSAAQASLKTTQRELTEARAQTSSLQQLDASLAAERQATEEAREVAKGLMQQVEKITHERDEARGIARQLHQKMATKSGPEEELKQLRATLETEKQNVAALIAERDRFSMQIDALGRQLEQERTARARALTERDEFKSRFKALASAPGGSSQENSQETTRPYTIEELSPSPTQEVPTVRGSAISTDPFRPAHVPPKKKGP